MKIKTFLYNLNDSPIIVLIAIMYSIHFFETTNLFNNEFFSSFFSRTDKFLRVLEIFIFFLYCYLYKKDKKHLLLAVLFFFAFFIIKSFSDSHLSFHLFFIPLFLSQFVDRKRLCSVLLILSVLYLCIIFIGHFLGYFQTEQFMRNGQIRYSLGFVHPNSLGFAVIMLSFLLILRNESVRIIDLVFISLSIVFLYYIPRSMTSVVLLTILLCFLFFIYFYKSKLDAFFDNKRRKILLFYFVVLLFLLTLFFTYFIAFTDFGKNVFLDMPGSIWARFDLGRIAYEKYGLSLFGTQIDSVFPDPSKNITEYFVVDCAYFYIPINYGVVSFLLYLSMIFILFKKASLNGDYIFVFVLMLILLYGVSETCILRPLIVPIFCCAFCSKKCMLSKEKMVGVIE